MIDMEKVINALEQCPALPFDMCYSECTNDDCPYYGEGGIEELHRVAVVLLEEYKEQKRGWSGPNKPFKVTFNFQYDCTKCGHPLIKDQPYCMNCGNKPIWEEAEK